MFTCSVFILILCCGVQCLSYNFFTNSSHGDHYLHRISRQATTCKPSERLCQSGECYPKRVFCDGFIDCEDGSDETSICARGIVSWDYDDTGYNKNDNGTCTALLSSTVDIKCIRNGLTVDCTKPFLHDTHAEVSCKQYYHLPPYDGIPAPYNRLICENGAWDFNLLECVPVCGMRNTKRIRRIILGNTAKEGEYPWHVGIHLKTNIDGNLTHDQICGGSIINSKLVVTAAHCVASKDPKKYGVAAGKYYRLWSDTRDENAQLRNVEQLHFPDGYKDLDTYANDIAIVVVDKPFVFDDFVRPICVVDWTDTANIDKKTLNDDTIGYVAGWGLVNPFGDYSEELKYVLLKIQRPVACALFLKKYLPSVAFEDKICIGRTDAQSVCVGDRGGGLAVQLGDSFYLIAIVSIAPTKDGTCDPWRYSMATKLSYYTQWIRKITTLNTSTH